MRTGYFRTSTHLSLMKAYRHIIAAVDFTPSCLHALREAIRQASLNHASVTVVHVMEEQLVEELKRALSTTEASIRAEWEAKLRKFVETSGGGSSLVKTEVRVGHPYAELMDACKSAEADLLVMGAKGSGAEASRVGVIAARCIRSSPIDVLVVRHNAEPPFKHVLACVDFSDNAGKAVTQALHFAANDKTDLRCLFVYQSAMSMALDYGGFITPLPQASADNEAMGHWQKELDRFVSPHAHNTGVPVKTVVVEQVNIRDAILDDVQQHSIDLVVLGTRGKSPIRHLLIGTTAEKIIHHAPCSILAVKLDAGEGEQKNPPNP